MSRDLFREMLAEFLGTFVLIVFGVGVVAQTVLSKQSAGSPLGDQLAWGLAVTMGCYVSGGVTGAHLNPAVTLALAVHPAVSSRQGRDRTSSRRWPARSSRRRWCT